MRLGTVISVGASWRGAIELMVDVDGVSERAIAYPEVVGTPAVAEQVLLNTTAVALGLGTGGYHLVIAIPARLPADPSGPGHIVKARYTSMQSVVCGVDEEDSPHRTAMEQATSLGGMPVVIADLHSALPAVLAAIRYDRPGTRIAYVMTDGGALPLWFSRTVAELSDRSWIVGSVTCGQSFGGDLEAVTLHSGLLAAKAVLQADVAVVAQGPGNLGVNTPWGFSGVAAGDAINAVAALGGRPVASLRISDADPRERHRGISHHSRTAVGTVALARAAVSVPCPLSETLTAAVRRDLDSSGIAAKHDVVDVDVTGLHDVLRASDVGMSTMGRGLEEDLAYFLAAAAAGRHAASLLT
jgi:hypothetical protein